MTGGLPAASWLPSPVSASARFALHSTEPIFTLGAAEGRVLSPAPSDYRGSDMQSQRTTVIRLLQFAMVAALVLPAALFAYASSVTYHSISTATDERIKRSLDVMHEQALRVFRSVELAFGHVDDMVRGLSDEQIHASEQLLHDRLLAIVKNLEQADSIWIIDRVGHPLASSEAYPVSAASDFSGRSFFRELAQADRGTNVGSVQVQPPTGTGVFSLNRRISSPGGVFVGVLHVVVSSQDFVDFFQRIGSPEGSYYALLREDGLFLARHPSAPSLPARLIDPAPAMQAIAERSGHGIYTTGSQVDGIERRIGYRKLLDFPVYLLAGFETSTMLREWKSEMASHLIFGIPATLLLFGSIGVVLGRTRRLYAEADRRALAEDALRQSQKMEAVGQLTGGVAHDFNNLLTIIMGNLEIAQRSLDNWQDGSQERLKRVVTAAMRGAQRAAELTKRLLAFSRRSTLDPRPVDVNRLIGGISDFLRRSVGEQVEIETVGAGGLWKVEVDPVELEAAIVNLAVNARDAMPDGGKLTIETSNAFLDENYSRRHTEVEPGQYVLVSVTDTGVGMTADVAERAFEPFFTTKTSGQGTGLGLSQVYGFVKQSGGHVKIYSEPGEGTTVRIYLPRLMREPSEDADSEAAIEPDKTGAMILVIEDDDDVRAYLVEVLRELSYLVFDAHNGASALALIESRKLYPDLLLTDVVLPGMNGREAAERIAAIRPGIKVLFMTGYSRNAIVHQGRLEPGVDMIQKPLTQGALAARISELLKAPAPAKAG
jgi:signal transduction histidine kinase/ActR/RegA family two-component response regulator